MMTASLASSRSNLTSLVTSRPPPWVWIFAVDDEHADARGDLPDRQILPDSSGNAQAEGTQKGLPPGPASEVPCHGPALGRRPVFSVNYFCRSCCLI